MDKNFKPEFVIKTKDGKRMLIEWDEANNSVRYQIGDKVSRWNKVYYRILDGSPYFVVNGKRYNLYAAILLSKENSIQRDANSLYDITL